MANCSFDKVACVPVHAVNHVVFEQVMKLLGLKSVVIHPNKSVVGVLYMLLSLT